MYYGGRGYHSVKELEELVESFRESAYQKQLRIQQLEECLEGIRNNIGFGGPKNLQVALSKINSAIPRGTKAKGK